MKELALVGRSAEDGLIYLQDEDGADYTLQVSPELRDAVFDREVAAAQAPAQEKELSPGKIQALLREGMSPAQVASGFGVDLERVTRFQSPVVAEVNHAVQMFLTAPLGSQADAPTMGDTAVDRLAERGVDTEALSWNATRQRRDPWQVSVSFVEDGLHRTAVWELKDSGTTPTAANEEARELTERTQKPEPVTALFPPVRPKADSLDETEAQRLLDRQEALLERLNAARGKRSVVFEEIDHDDADDPFPPPSDPRSGGASERGKPVQGAKITVVEEESVTVVATEAVSSESGGESQAGFRDPQSPESGGPESNRVHSERVDSGRVDSSGPESAHDEDADHDAGDSAEQSDTGKPRGRRGRRPMPSWDEIVFGYRDS